MYTPAQSVVSRSQTLSAYILLSHAFRKLAKLCWPPEAVLPSPFATLDLCPVLLDLYPVLLARALHVLARAFCFTCLASETQARAETRGARARRRTGLTNHTCETTWTYTDVTASARGVATYLGGSLGLPDPCSADSKSSSTHGSGMVPPLLNILRLVLGPTLVFSFIMHTSPNTAEDISCISAVYQRLHCTQTTTCSALFTQTRAPTRRGLHSAPVNGCNET